jgi:hypothetical protein
MLLRLVVLGKLIQEQSVEPILQPNFTYVKACAGTNTQLVNTRIQVPGPQGFLLGNNKLF